MDNIQSSNSTEQSAISNQQSAINYNENHANKMYSGAIASNHGVKHIVSAFYLAKQAGVNIDEVRLIRAKERRKQREKCSNVQMFSGITFSHVSARTLYNRENAPYGATNTRNANVDYDDEAFENMPDSLPWYCGCHRQHTISLCAYNVWRQMDVS